MKHRWLPWRCSGYSRWAQCQVRFLRPALSDKQLLTSEVWLFCLSKLTLSRCVHHRHTLGFVAWTISGLRRPSLGYAVWVVAAQLLILVEHAQLQLTQFFFPLVLLFSFSFPLCFSHNHAWSFPALPSVLYSGARIALVANGCETVVGRLFLQGHLRRRRRLLTWRSFARRLVSETRWLLIFLCHGFGLRRCLVLSDSTGADEVLVIQGELFYARFFSGFLWVARYSDVVWVWIELTVACCWAWRNTKSTADGSHYMSLSAF